MVNRRSARTPKLTNINSGAKSVSEQLILNKSSGRKCAVRINRESVSKLIEEQSKNLLDCIRNPSKKNLFELDQNITMKADLNVENEGMSTPLRRVTRKTAKLSLKSPEVHNDESTPVKQTIDITKFAKLSLRTAKKNEIPSTPTTSKSADDAQGTKDTISELLQVDNNAQASTPTTRVTRRKFRAVGNTPRPANNQVEENVSVKENLKPVTRKRGNVGENASTPAKKKKNEVVKENQSLLSKSSENEENLNTPIKESVKRVTRKQRILSVENNESTPVRRITRKSVKYIENESASMKGMERKKIEEDDLKVQEIQSSPIKSTADFDTSKNLSNKEIEDILMEVDEPVNEESGEIGYVPSFKKPTKKKTKILSSYLKIDKPSSTKKPETIEDDDIYELQVSQPSASETEDMTLFEKLAKEGKVQIKHKSKRAKTQTITKKKRYLNTSRTWYRIERNIGISPKKLNLLKSKKINDDVKPTATNLNKDSNLLNEKTQIEHVALIHNEPNAPATTDQSLLDKIESIPDISMNTSLPSTSSSSPLLPRNVNNLRNKSQTTDKNKLLEFAKSFVSQSTPIAKKKNAGAGNSAVKFSPILPSSPWCKTTSINPNDSSHIDSFLSVDFNDSIIKNLSNAENIPPVIQQQQQQQQNRTITSSTTTENKLTDILSSKQNIGISTPSRQFSKVIGKRNPLKEINILEVINLPPLPLRARRIDELSSVLNKSKLNENTEDTIQIDNDYNKKKSNDKDTTANYFGFDEIEETEESNDADKATDTTIIPQKSHLKKKLQKLQKLLPPIQRNLRNKSPVKKLPLFGEIKSKQVKLHEMLSSTMINSTSVPAGGNDVDAKNDAIESYDELNESEIAKDTNDTVVTVDLFGELQDPETTLDSTKIKKTYSRQKKKPRRYFVFFSDNETDSEPEDEQGGDGEGKNRKRKKQRKKPDKPQYDKKELNKFAEEFNSMCEEAENYELVKEIESSTLNV